MSDNKIDYVLTYLDPTDPTWIESFISTTGRKPPARHHNLDDQTQLFKYNIRGISENMQFINKLHIIVFSKSQIPTWINQDEVDIITHDEFVESKYLPVFNSSTYKVFYGNLPRVSNQFISASDDYYLLNKFSETEFFTQDTHEPIIEQLKGAVNLNTEWSKVLITCNKLAKKITKQKDDCVYRWYHYPHAYLKSYCKDILDKYYNDLVQTITRERKCSKNIEQIFWILCEYFKYHNVRPNEDMKLVLDERSSNETCYKYPDLFTLKKKGIKCLNLNYIKPNDIGNVVQQFDKIFPNKCKYEN